MAENTINTQQLLGKKPEQEQIEQTVSTDMLLNKGAKPISGKETTYDGRKNRTTKHPHIVDTERLKKFMDSDNESIRLRNPYTRDKGRVTRPSRQLADMVTSEVFFNKEQAKYQYEKVLSFFERQYFAAGELGFRVLDEIQKVGAMIPDPKINNSVMDKMGKKVAGWVNEGVDYFSQPEKYGYWTKKALPKRVVYSQSHKNFAMRMFNDMTENATDALLTILSLKGLRTLNAAKGTVTALGLGKTSLSAYKGVGQIGAYGFITKGGDFKERTKNAATLMGYNITPYIANATGATGWQAVGVDTLLNSFLSLSSYVEAHKEAEGFNKEFVSLALPVFTMDLAFAWRTRGLSKNIQEQRTRNYLNNRMESFRLDPKEGMEYMDRIRTEIGDKVKPSIKEQIVKTQREEVREKRKGVKAIEQEIKEKAEKAEPKKDEVEKNEIREQIERVKETQVYTKSGDLRKNAEKGLERVKKLEQNLAEFEKQKKLRQTIRSFKSVKGMSDAELTRITKKRTGHAKLTHKDMMAKDLEKVLDSVKRTRPKFVGHKKVVTPKTESKLRNLRKTMIDKEELTEEDFENILDVHNVYYLGYRSKTSFMSEAQAKDVIKDMLYTAPLVKDRTQTKRALEKKPVLNAIYTKLEEHYKNKYKDRLARVNGMLDMHHFADSMEKQTGLPFGLAWERLNETRQSVEARVDGILDEMHNIGGKDFQKISQDREALDRIDQYISSRLPQYIEGKPEMPKNITKTEKAIADNIIKNLKNFEEMVRYNRFYEWYEKGTRIPNAPEKELNKATDILESKGDDALREWLKGRSWGVMKGGYNIGEMLQPKVRAYRQKAALSKKGLRTRESKKYIKPEEDILKRYAKYTRSIMMRTELKSRLNAWQTLFNNNTDAFYDPKAMSARLERNAKEMVGQRERLDLYEKIFQAAYGQAMRATFTDLRKGVRNLFQNLAFYISVDDALRARPLTKAEKDYFDTYVSQSKGIRKDWLYSEINWVKTLRESDNMVAKTFGLGLKPLEMLNSLADTANVMGRSDDINRGVAFRMKLGKVKSGLRSNPDYLKSDKAFNKMMKDIGIGDLTLMETKHAVRKLAVEGEDAFARYVAKGVTQKVHFLYERVQREPIAQGSELSRILTNLLTFRKGYVQRLTQDISKFRPSDSKLNKAFGSKRRATRSLLGATAGAFVIGTLYQAITGDDRNPYRIDYITEGLSLGGLATGAQQQIGDLSYTTSQALRGDERAKKQVLYKISSTADTFIPLYNDFFNILESTMDTENLDQQWFDQVKDALDKRYRAKPKQYWFKQRNLLEKGQHAIFGTEQED